MALLVRKFPQLIKNIECRKCGGQLVSRNFTAHNKFHGNASAKSVYGECKGKTVSLSEPLPGLPEVEYATVKSNNNATHMTTLQNGLTVASETRFGQFCTVGVVIDSGPRYEDGYPGGISHFLEKLAFQSTVHYPEKDVMFRELEKHGGICDCQSSRDTFIYAASADTRGLESVVRLLADVILRPKLLDDEVNFARKVVQFELETLSMRPEQEAILMDMVHAAAYLKNTLGLPKLCPSQSLDIIDRKILYKYLKSHYTPKRMVVAGVGVNHEELVRHCEKYFMNEKPIWYDDHKSLETNAEDVVITTPAHYTGGSRTEECEIPIYNASGLPELAHVVIGLEGCSHQDNDFVATCVLNIMMGGGGSFSAGGPGKGMYTRLYTNVLNRYHWMHSAAAYNHAYADTGLFCIHASAPPSNVKGMVEVITKELATMTTKPSDQELKRAKRQLQSMLMMNLEARPVVFEDIGRQVLATGTRRRPEYFLKQIENTSAEDIQRVARRLLSSPPSLAARGGIKSLPDVKDIQAALVHYGGKLLGTKRLSLFR